MNEDRVCITGAGIVCRAGWQADSVWHLLDPAARTEGRQIFDNLDFGEMPLDEQIPNRSDRRAMGPSMLAGCCAAGLALDRARLKGDIDRLKRLDILVACRITERDAQADDAVLLDVEGLEDTSTLITRLKEHLRPTFFLTQIPNLLAANISIVHGATGSSLTFLGNEAAGVDAVQTGADRIQHGLTDICLVGGVFREHREVVSLGLGAADLLRYSSEAEVERYCVVPGSSAAFLVLESLASARARSLKPLAYLSSIWRRDLLRTDGYSRRTNWQLLREIADEIDFSRLIVVSTGGEPLSLIHEEILSSGGIGKANFRPPVLEISVRMGALFEAAFPTGLVAALLCLEREVVIESVVRGDAIATGHLTAPKPVERVLVNSFGLFGGEAAAMVERVEDET